ncbi:MAG: DUF1636 domain-containing protein [Alphaproteobacteria bacterium]|nr:DUF1636 domain-containing protein [Alphaproteobacteria bacterium]
MARTTAPKRTAVTTATKRRAATKAAAARRGSGKQREREGGNGAPRGARQREMQTMYVCRSCVWDHAVEVDGVRQGALLAEAIEKIYAKWARRGDLNMRVVYCLGGCLNPCNVGFRTRGKYFYRFNKLTPQNAQALIDFAAAYIDSPMGDIPPAELPKGLQGHMVVRVPPPARL